MIEDEQIERLLEYIEDLMDTAYDEGTRKHGLDTKPSEFVIRNILGLPGGD